MIKTHDQISLLMDQYVHHIISPRDIDTLTTMHVVGIIALITNNGAKRVSLAKNGARLIINDVLL